MKMRPVSFLVYAIDRLRNASVNVCKFFCDQRSENRTLIAEDIESRALSNVSTA